MTEDNFVAPKAPKDLCFNETEFVQVSKITICQVICLELFVILF